MDRVHIKDFFSKGPKKGRKANNDTPNQDTPERKSQERPSSGLSTSPYAEAVQGEPPRYGALPIHGKQGAYSTAPRPHRQGFTVGTLGSAFGSNSSPVAPSPPSPAVRPREWIANTQSQAFSNDEPPPQEALHPSKEPRTEGPTERTASSVLRLETPRVAPPQPPTTPMDILSDPLLEKPQLIPAKSPRRKNETNSWYSESDPSDTRLKDQVDKQTARFSHGDPAEEELRQQHPPLEQPQVVTADHSNGSEDLPPDSTTKTHHSRHHHHAKHHHPETAETSISESAGGPPASEGMIKLHHHEDTTVKTHYAPPVYHETIKPHVHHIKQEQIHREVHNHHVYHRILPIIDVKVLPTKHYAYDNAGQLVEIADPNPRSMTGHLNKNWVIAETLTKYPPAKTHDKHGKSSDSNTDSRRQFTARTFEGSEGDEQVYIRDDGVAVTESTWIYPPTVEDGGRRTGQTVPMIFRHDIE